jgi:hypothetical protein
MLQSCRRSSAFTRERRRQSRSRGRSRERECQQSDAHTPCQPHRACRYGAGDVDAAVALWGAALMVLGESTSSTAAARAEVLMAKAAALAKLGLHEQALSHTTEALDGPCSSFTNPH